MPFLDLKRVENLPIILKMVKHNEKKQPPHPIIKQNLPQKLLKHRNLVGKKKTCKAGQRVFIVNIILMRFIMLCREKMFI